MVYAHDQVMDTTPASVDASAEKAPTERSSEPLDAQDGHSVKIRLQR